MKNKFILIITILFLSLQFASCSGGSDGSDGANAPAPEEEEDTGGGTSGGSGGGSACLSTTQKDNITKLFNRLADMSSVNGVFTKNGEAIFAGDYSFSKENDSSWQVVVQFCELVTDPQCGIEAWGAAFRNGCFSFKSDLGEFYRSKIVSSSSNSLRFTTSDPEIGKIDTSISISSEGKVRVREGSRVFEEE
jgi:hypothetical protein